MPLEKNNCWTQEVFDYYFTIQKQGEKFCLLDKMVNSVDFSTDNIETMQAYIYEHYKFHLLIDPETLKLHQDTKNNEIELEQAVMYFRQLENPLRSLAIKKHWFHVHPLFFNPFVELGISIPLSFLLSVLSYKVVKSLLYFLVTTGVQESNSSNLVYLGVQVLSVLLAIVIFALSAIKGCDLLVDLIVKQDEHTLNPDYAIFLKILKKYPNALGKNKDFFLTYDGDNNLTFELYNRIKIFALDSFLEAARQDNTKALKLILRPIQADILKEAVKFYREYQDIERSAAKMEKQRLEKQIQADLHAYENRLFK